MTYRCEKLLLLTALGLLLTAPGCASDSQGDEGTTEPTESELTSGFQSGVGPSSSYAGATDTTIRESAPTTNDGAGATVSADFDDPAGTRKRTSGLLRFDIRSIPAGSKVSAVKLTVNVTNRTSGSGYLLYPMLRSWSDSQATWQLAATGAPWGSPGARGAGDRSSAAIGVLTPLVTGKATISFNAAGITAVQQWVDNPAQNFGFLIETPDDFDGVGFDSSNASVAANRPQLGVTYDAPMVASRYPIYTASEVDAWSTTSAEYTRLAGSWAGNVNRPYAAYGTQVSSVERDVLKDEAVYIKTQAVLWAADGNPARKTKVAALLDSMRSITSWQTDTVEQYRLVAGWATTNLAQAAALIGYKDAQFTRFLVDVCYPIMTWPGANNWQASFADSKLAIAVYTGDAALYADAKAYFYLHLPQTAYHSAYDGNKVRPTTNAAGVASATDTIRSWGGYWGAPQVKADYTFVNPSYVVDGFNSETIRDLGHVSMGLGAWMHGARTIRAHGDVLQKEAYDRLRAGYALHAKRVLSYKNTGATGAPTTVKGTGGGDQGWYGARKLFGSDTPADVVTLCNHPDVTGFASAGANHLVDEAFADAY